MLPATPPADLPTSPTVAASDLAACTILLVDDEEANLDLLEDLLRRKGFHEIVRTSDAREAVPLFERTRPDVVLLDLHMPFRSGYEVLADIRANTPPDAYLPVLVLTADVTFAAKQRALVEGAHDFVTKPFVNAEVLLRVRNLLQTRALYRAQQAAREAAEAAQRRSALLADASRVLGASFDSRTALAQLARVLVPSLADGCTVELRQEEGLVPVAQAGLAAAPAGHEPDDAGQHAARLAIPLATAAGTVGRLTLVRGGAAPFTADEVALAEELAHRAALAVEYARLYLDARTATEDRERILAVVAHDLRTPLCALLMDAEVMQSLGPSVLGASHHVAAARMYRTVRRMDGLIDDLLEVTRVDRGALELDLQERALDHLLGEAADMLRPLVAANGLELQVDAPVPSPRVRVDDARVLQVISNLVGNAAKFTPSPGVVTLSAAVVDDECRVVVRDTGPGIPPDQLPHLFGAFWQARTADRRGLGLGLAIARGIVEAHGGRIWAASEAGQGTTFTFSLPLSTAARRA